MPYKDPEVQRKYVREWKAENSEKNLGYKNQWKVSHPDTVRAIDRASKQRRRSRIRQNKTERFQDIEIFERDSWICQLCFEPIDPSIKRPDTACVSLDHIVPLSKMGSHTRENVQAAHFLCNLKKGNSTW